MSPEALADLLHKYGGWGLSAILMIVVWRMASYIMKLHKEQKDDTKELVEALVSTKNTLENFRDTMNALSNRLP